MDVQARRDLWFDYCRCASMKGGCTSAIKGYDAQLAGTRKIGETFRLVCIAKGQDPLDVLRARRNAMVEKMNDASAAMADILEEDPELTAWACQSPAPWHERPESAGVDEATPALIPVPEEDVPYALIGLMLLGIYKDDGPLAAYPWEVMLAQTPGMRERVQVALRHNVLPETAWPLLGWLCANCHPNIAPEYRCKKCASDAGGVGG